MKSLSLYYFLLIIVGLVLIFLSGCDRQTRYSILTTVFTGVPPYEEYYAEKKPPVKVVEIEKKAELFYHPLWKDGQCQYCHEKNAEAQQLEKDTLDTTIKSEDTALSDLLLPPEKLCIRCHIDKTSRRAIRDRLWLHNPVAKGNCLSCHAEHESKNIAHLRWPTEKICISCHEHDEKNIPSACHDEPESKRKDLGCLACHNAHMGKDRFLLTRDFMEIKEYISPVQSQ